MTDLCRLCVKSRQSETKGWALGCVSSRNDILLWNGSALTGFIVYCRVTNLLSQKLYHIFILLFLFFVPFSRAPSLRLRGGRLVFALTQAGCYRYTQQQCPGHLVDVTRCLLQPSQVSYSHPYFHNLFSCTAAGAQKSWHGKHIFPLFLGTLQMPQLGLSFCCPKQLTNASTNIIHFLNVGQILNRNNVSLCSFSTQKVYELGKEQRSLLELIFTLPVQQC